jgi:hypothetical protein
MSHPDPSQEYEIEEGDRNHDRQKEDEITIKPSSRTIVYIIIADLLLIALVVVMWRSLING